MKLDKVCAAKIQWWGRHRLDIPNLKVINHKEEREHKCQVGVKHSRANILSDFLFLLRQLFRAV